MIDFVSGQSHIPGFKPRVIVHDEPIPWDERPAIRPAFVSHAVQAKMERTAAVRAEREAKPEPTKSRKRTATKFVLPDPFHGCEDWYDLDPQVKRMRREVSRIRNRMDSITNLFGTIENPNRAVRLEYAAIMKRMRHEIDMVV